MDTDVTGVSCTVYKRLWNHRQAREGFLEEGVLRKKTDMWMLDSAYFW